MSGINRPIRAAMGHLGRTQIRFVSAVSPSAAPPHVALVYRQVERDFGLLAPPIALHAAATVPLAACWMMLRETLVVDGLVGRAVKEAVATAVSAVNACPFCATIHTATLDVLAHKRRTSSTDPALDRVMAWAGSGGTPPFPTEHTPELVGVAVLLHYLNRMVNVFLGELPLPPGVPAAALGPTMWVLSRVIRRASRRDHQPGESLNLLPPAGRPVDLSWAAGNPLVAEAFTRAIAWIQVVGECSVPTEVRHLVTQNLANWHGEPRGISRAWVEDDVLTLPVTDRPAGRLALLTAFASYQVDAAVVAEFRRVRPDDRALVELTSWASLTAAQRMGERLWLTRG